MAIIARPDKLYTGIKEAYFAEGWENDKHFYVEQANPFPCSIAAVDLYCETTNE